MAFKSIAELKKSRGVVADLQKQVEQMGSKGFEKDPRFWQPTADKAGTGSAVIRFLPAPKGEDLPWVRVWTHNFQGPTGKWYIENSLTTLGQEDPVSVLNTELWNSGDAGKEVARKQKRKLGYYSNILVVTDSAHPENEGKVFLFKYGKKIFDKIKDAMNPPKEFEDEKEVSPFDFWEGADFRLKFRKVEGYRNYDKSAFMEVSPVSESDAQLNELWESEHSLAEFVAPSKFKTYAELEKKLNAVLKGGAVGTAASKSDEDDEEAESEVKSAPKAKRAVVEEEDEEEVKPKAKKKVVVEEEEEEVVKPKGKKKVVVEEEEEVKPKSKTKVKTKDPVEDEDDVLSHFAKLAEDDED